MPDLVYEFVTEDTSLSRVDREVITSLDGKCYVACIFFSLYNRIDDLLTMNRQDFYQIPILKSRAQPNWFLDQNLLLRVNHAFVA